MQKSILKKAPESESQREGLYAPGCFDGRIGRVNLWFLLLAAIVYASLLATLSQQFVGSHPDEIGKARQIASEFRNWNHPQFLLLNLQLVSELFDITQLKELVITGRYISNVYAAATVLLLAFIGARLFGAVGAWVFFGASAASSTMLIAGRYLKEDIFLCFGLAIMVLSLTFPVEKKKWNIGGIIGSLGCAIVLSSKYIGIIFVVIFLVSYFYQRRVNWRDHVMSLVLPFLAAIVAINYNLLLSIKDFVAGFGKEFNHATIAHDGIISGPWSDLYLDMVTEVWPLSALVAIPVFLFLLWRTGCRKSVAALLAFSLASILVYGLAIQWAPTKVPRYSFPLLFLLLIVFLVAAGELWRNAKASWLRLAIMILGLILFWQTARTSVTLVRAMTQDTRDQLLDYVTTSPKLTNALIMTDAYSRLWRRLDWEENPRPNYLPRRKVASWLTYERMKQQLEAKERTIQNPNGIRLRWCAYAADPCFFGECDDVDYIVITCTAFTRFFRNDIKLDRQNARRKTVYENWLKKGDILKRFGSYEDDLENRLGLYESPCIYILRNSKP